MIEKLRELGIAIRDEAGRAPVALPESAQEVVAVVRAARGGGWVVAPHYVGRDLGARSVRVSLELDSGTIETLPADLLALAPGGVTVGRLAEVLDEHGLFWPVAEFVDPGEMLSDVVARAPGNWSLLGNVLRRYVLALQAVLPSGDIVTAGARTVKSVTGYDLKQLFVGSAGTLGIVVSVTLRVESEKNRAEIVERYRRDFAELGEGAAAGPGRAPGAAGPGVASEAASGDGSRVILERLKAEIDPAGVFPSIETVREAT